MYQFARFAATRAALAVITLIIVSFIVFSLMELVPGDCAERYLAFKNTQGSQISVADIEAERVRLGLDKPYIVRWGSWIVNAFQGEFGNSCILRVNIAQLLGEKFWISLGICLTSLVLAYLIAMTEAYSNGNNYQYMASPSPEAEGPRPDTRQCTAFN